MSTLLSRVEASWQLKQVSFKYQISIMYAGIFAVTAAAALIQGFCVPNSKVTFMYDSRSYLMTTTLWNGLLSGLITGHAHWSLITDPINYSQILKDGLGFPLINAIIFVFCNHMPSLSEWWYLIFPQACWLGLSSCLCAYIAHKITTNNYCMLAAGLLWGFYPAAILCVERYLTEILSATLLLACVAVLCSINSSGNASVSSSRNSSVNTSGKNDILVGVLAGIAALTRAALLPISVLCIGVAIIFATRKYRLLILSLIGLTCVLASWAFYTKAVGGKLYVTPQRYTAYNFAVGSDLSSDGWCTYPHTNFQSLFENSDDTFAVTLAQWQEYPKECMVLTIKKLSRLFAQPWNDFRHTVFGLGINVQRAYHNVILSLGIFGIVFFTAIRRFHTKSEENLGVWLCITAFLGHLIYILFQSISRYTFTGMPYLCVLAIYGVWAVIQECRDGAGRYLLSKIFLVKLSTVTVVSLSIVLFLQHAEALMLSEHGELAHELKAGEHIITSIDLSSSAFPKRNFEAYILIDGDYRSSKAQLFFNGHLVTNPLMPDYCFYSSAKGTEHMLKEFSTACGVSPDYFRRWYMAAVPSNWISTRNVIDLKTSAYGCTIYSDPAFTRDIKNLDSFALDKSSNSLSDNETREYNSDLITARCQSSSVLVAIPNKQTLLKDYPRIKLLLALSPGNTVSQSKLADRACPMFLDTKKLIIY